MSLRRAAPLALILVGACAAIETRRHGADPPPTTAASAAEREVPARRFLTDAAPPARWWEAFGCAPLNDLVEQALLHSPTVLEARARLTEAEEDLTAQRRGSLFPRADADLGVSRQKFDPAAFGIPNVPQGPPFTLFNAQVNVSYTLDLFGGVRHANEGVAAERDYQRFEAEAAELTLAANVVTAAIRLADLAAEIDYTQQDLEARTRQSVINAARYQAGGISLADLKDQNAALERARAALPPLVAEQARVGHQLAVYTGMAPEKVPVPTFRLEDLRLPTDVPVTLPADLVKRRPDVRAANALWNRSDAAVGVATANLLPNLTLSGSAGSERTRSSELLDSFNVWSLGAKLLQPIFHAGELRAKRRAALAEYRAMAAAYEATVLTSFQQVADALRILEADALVLKARATQASESAASLGIATDRFAVGGISESALLDAKRQDLGSRLDRTRAEAARLTDTAALLHAVAGLPDP